MPANSTSTESRPASEEQSPPLIQLIFIRANYICTIWNNAHLKNPTSYGPENNGWVLKNEQYHFKWFEGDQLPNYVSDSLTTLSGM